MNGGLYDATLPWSSATSRAGEVSVPTTKERVFAGHFIDLASFGSPFIELLLISIFLPYPTSAAMSA